MNDLGNMENYGNKISTGDTEWAKHETKMPQLSGKQLEQLPMRVQD